MRFCPTYPPCSGFLNRKVFASKKNMKESKIVEEKQFFMIMFVMGLHISILKWTLNYCNPNWVYKYLQFLSIKKEWPPCIRSRHYLSKHIHIPHFFHVPMTLSWASRLQVFFMGLGSTCLTLNQGRRKVWKFGRSIQ